MEKTTIESKFNGCFRKENNYEKCKCNGILHVWQHKVKFMSYVKNLVALAMRGSRGDYNEVE